MYNSKASQFVGKTMLDIVNHIMKLIDIFFTADLCMKRDNYSSGAVVMDNKIMYTYNLIIRKNDFLNLFNKLLFGRAAEKRSERFLCRIEACVNNKQ